MEYCRGKGFRKIVLSAGYSVLSTEIQSFCPLPTAHYFYARAFTFAPL